MRLNTSIVPPGGFHYPIDKGVTIQAHDKPTLVDRMYEYRVRHSLPTGNEDRDVDEYFCRKWPSSCNKEASDYDTRLTPTGKPAELLLHRVSRWASGLIDVMPRGGYQLVPASEVERRAHICRTCPQNANWRTGCRGCSGSTVSLLNQVRRLLKAPVGLMGCQVLGFDTATAAYIAVEKLPKNSGVPDHCWCK